MAAAPSALGKLWPNTLTKFWGAQAIGWSAASFGLALLLAAAPAGSPGAVLAGAAWALAGANAALAVLLYRTTEEASTALGLAGVASFAGITALVHGLAGSGLSGAALPAARTLRLWHVAMTVGSVVFALIKSNKDRLFAQGGDLVRSGMLAGTSRGAAVPLLVIINQAAGAKLGAKVGAALRERAERVASKGGAMRVADVAETPPAEALAAFGAEHDAYRVLVCGGVGTVKVADLVGPQLATTGSSDCIGGLEAAPRTQEERPIFSDPTGRPRSWSHASPKSPTSLCLTM